MSYITEQDWANISDEAKDLLFKKLLAKEPKERIDALTALQHPWFDNYKEAKEINTETEKNLLTNLRSFHVINFLPYFIGVVQNTDRRNYLDVCCIQHDHQGGGRGYEKVIQVSR